MEKEQPSKFKILMFPWLAHGHINPFLQLAKRLSTRNFALYLCSTPVNLDSIKPSIRNEHSSDCDDPSIIKLVELHVPSSPELPPEMHTTKNLPSDLIPTLISAFQMSSTSFSEILNSLKPDLLIYDLFQPWAPKLASSRNIPSVYFSTSGATPFAFHHHMHTMGPDSPFPYEAIYLQEPHKWTETVKLIESLVKDADKEDFFFGNLTLSTDIVLESSSREVEAKYIDYLSVLSKKRVVPTGPLVSYANDDDDDNDANSEIMKWLSGKSRGSTVYMSFGSECFLSDEQIAEIAKGLQLSNTDFVWVIRSPLGEETINPEEKLPRGFLETVKGRGLIIPGWAPQAKILGHPSIGGFVSHCGWNGAMQGMYFGVPIIALPMQFEQPIIARLVVEVGVGVEVEKGKNGDFSGEELAKAINKVVSEKGFYEGLRDRAKRLSEKMKESAEAEMNEVAEQLHKICVKNKKQV